MEGKGKEGLLLEISLKLMGMIYSHSMTWGGLGGLEGFE